MKHEQPQFIALTPELAKELIVQMQAVLDGDPSYFHVALLTDDGKEVSLHLRGPDNE